MLTKNKIPFVNENEIVRNALKILNKKKLGFIVIINNHGLNTGIFTDGDLRRSIDKGLDLLETPMGTVMSNHPITVTENILAAEAMKIMEDNSITVLLVENEDKMVVGIVHMHDLISKRVV